jgi:amino acid adenylation domain-containing protein
MPEKSFNLTPAKRALLEALLKEKALSFPKGRAISRRETGDPAPLSFAQQRMWFLALLERDAYVYNVPSAYHIQGPLDIQALEDSLNEIVRRHAILRTTFIEINREARQLVAPELKIEINRADWRSVPEAKRETAARRILVEWAHEPFDLAHEPLLRLHLLQFADQEYYLLINFHHIIIDEWSMDLLFNELQQLYPAKLAGRPVDLPELPIQYADYAVWQAEWLQGGVVEKQLSYWKEKLAGAPQMIELKQDYPRPAVLSYRGAHQERLFSGRLLDGLRELSKTERVTLFTTLLAAFQVLLYRYTGQVDMLLGTPIANRRQIELENLIGFFLNTLVIRCDLSGAPTFRQLLKRVETTVLEAFDNQDLPFEKLVEELNPQRDRSRHPLFQVSFVLNSAAARELQLPGLQTSRLALDFGGSKFDLTIYLVERLQGLHARLEYNTDLFETATIERMVGHYETLLQEIVSNPDCSIDRLQMLSAAERQMLLFDWNRSRRIYARDLLIHQLVEAQAMQNPDAVALLAGDQQPDSKTCFSMTYGELNRQANRIAHYLRQRGIGPESVVGVLMQRSPMMVAALLGVLKAGGAYLPLDPANPPERLAFMIRDAGMQLTLSQAALKGMVEGLESEVIYLDCDWELFQAQQADNPENLASLHNRAYIIYTSGSTGQPKGVELEHGGLLNLVHWHNETFEITAADRATQVAGLSFDASVWEIWPYLVKGARLYLLVDEKDLSPERLVDWLVANAITISFLPTPVVETVLNIDWPEGTALRALLTGGDRLHLNPSSRLPFSLVNNYGPTECTVVATSGVVRAIGEANSTRVATPIGIGRPIANAQMYVLDRFLNLVPVGVAGELYIGGAGVGRGYLNKPGLTAEQFVPNPFLDLWAQQSNVEMVGADRLYRTGDLVRYLPDGELEYLGRTDTQVKLRGLRIELGEIEAALLAQPGVKQAVVALQQLDVEQNLAIPGVAGEKRLVAYIVPDSQVELNFSVLRNDLKSRLPGYMLPAVFVPLPELPLSPNGKVDRKALPAPVLDRSMADDRYMPPRDELENSLCQVWEAVLNIHPVGIYDNFFELGGHSLLAIRLAGQIQEQLGQQLPIGVIFQSPTVAGLAETLRQADKAVPRMVIPRRATGEPAPMSFGQERMWFLDQMGVGAQAYNVPTAFRIKGPLDVAALERSLNRIIQRHEILRTTFVELDGEPRQVVAPALALHVDLEDLSGIPPAGLEQTARRRLLELGRRSFDLARGPLIYVNVLRIAEYDHFLLLNMHHIISDEWSAEVFNRELAQLYQAEIQEVAASLPELPIQYADYAAWQIEWLKGQNETEQLDYWKQKLSGAPQVLDLPADHPRPAAPSYRGGRKSHRLTGELLSALQRLSRSEQVTLFVTLLAAFQVMLYRYTGQEDLLVGSPIANRRQFELENLIGFFLNTLVFRANLKGNPGFWEVVQRVSEAVLEAFDHQDLPFERLVEELKPPRDLGRHPLFQTMFVFLPPQLQRLQIAGLEIEPVSIDYGWSKFDLTLFVHELPDAMELSLEYSTDLFDPLSIERMLEHYELLLRGMVADPDRPVAYLPILTAAEQDLLRSWNATRADYPDGTCVHQLFELQAERAPDAPALEQPGYASLTYAELNSRANRLAHFLREMGVLPDAPVGIYLERSTDLIVAVLGILKAGGACLPLDPGYPRKRLEYMCADAQLEVILTHSHLVAGLPETSARILCLDSQNASPSAQAEANPLCLTTPDNLAYVLYTSGSTGQPKGVMMRHRPLVNLLSWQMRNFSAAPDARTLQLTSLNFDVSFQEILVTLSSGGCLVLVSEEIRKDLPRLLEYIQANAIARLFLSFVALQALAESAGSLGLFPASLREVITAGEQLQATPEIALLFERLPGCRLHNQYGPTETHVVSAYSLPGTPQDWPPLPPIGKPIANTYIRLLDTHLGLSPVGVIGEIYLGGDCLARGYLRRPALTAERFIPDPLGMPGEQFYRTGDLGRYLPDGDIQFLGRADLQVKIRGFRVEPAEVELTLAGHPLVRQTAVLALPAQTGEKRLVAYLVPEAGATLQVEDLRAYLRSRLPDYMIPSAFLVMDAMPLTPSGKVDRLALAASADFSVGRLQTRAGYAPPHDKIEQQLCQIWEAVLGIDQVGIEDDFFELGGHSLLAIRLFTRIERELGQRLPLSTLFEAPTVARLAEYLRRTGPGADWSPLVVIQEHGSQPPFFCVHNFGGEVINLNDLAQALGADQPFIGLQAQGLDGRVEPHATIPEMAACYVQAIRSRQPAGPYYLGGFCFGGVVAYEMACQLQAQGEQVALLALFDAYAPARVRHGRLVGRLQRTVTFFKNLPFWWRDFLELDEGERRVVVKRRFTRIGKATLRLLGRQAQMTPRDLIGDHAHVEEAPAHVQRLMELHMLALLNYAPPEYAGRVTLFRTQRIPLFTYVSPDTGWGSIVHQGVEIVITPGAHQNILRPPYVQELAKRLSQSLQQARSRFIAF